VTDAQAEAAKRVRAAEADANQIRWNAQAEANGMQAKMQQLKEHPELPCYMAYKKWDGKLSDVSSGQTMPFAEACVAVK
jgi:regulator of protease activity HflC (stomatin/prohibitin superfamily)